MTSNLNLCFLELIAKISKQNVHKNISLGLFRLGKFLEGFLQKMQYLWVNRRVYRIMPSKCIFSWEFCYNSRQEGDRPSRLRPQRPPSESLVSHFSKARFTLILFRGGGGLKKGGGDRSLCLKVIFLRCQYIKINTNYKVLHTAFL